jgi:hypothetical protein
LPDVLQHGIERYACHGRSQELSGGIPTSKPWSPESAEGGERSYRTTVLSLRVYRCLVLEPTAAVGSVVAQVSRAGARDYVLVSF